jgi:DNA-binding CsgD family transcriptional regulator
MLSDHMLSFGAIILLVHPGSWCLELGAFVSWRDEHDGILYVGKAKSLRKRLNSYRVANPERLPRRLLRLLHLARTIDWEICDDEAATLARERELLLTLKPRSNRAGVWVGPPKFLVRRLTEPGIELAALTPTERRVLRLIGANRTTKEIAHELCISPRTVDTHRAHIGERLKLRGAQALLRFALENRAEL